MNEEKLTYEAAYAELKDIMSELEGDDVSVDVLSQKMRRALQLIEFCKKKLTAVEDDVARLLHGDDDQPSE